MAEAKQYEYRDPARTMAVLRVAVLVQMAVLAATFVAFVLQYNLLQDIRHGAFPSRAAMIAAADAGDLRVQVLGVIGMITIAAAIITFLFWVYRASANAHALGAQELSSGAGLAVGYYFIPFANLVMPLVNMSQVEKASRDARTWQSLSVWWGVPLWWVIWLVMNGAGLVIAVATNGAKDLDAIEAVIKVQCGYKFLELTAYALMLAVAGRVTRLQREQHDRQAVEPSF